MCVKTELPISAITRPASESELPQVERLLDLGATRGLLPKTLILDRGYDVGHIFDECHRRRIRLVCPLKPKDKGRDGHRVPTSRHGRHEYRWKYVGTDINRGSHGASKWRCPVGLCRSRSTWITLDRFHASIPRDTSRSHAIYDHRTAIKRLWARFKREWGYLELRVRGQDRVAQHVDLIVLAHLMFGLAKLRAHSPNPVAREPICIRVGVSTVRHVVWNTTDALRIIEAAQLTRCSLPNGHHLAASVISPLITQDPPSERGSPVRVRQRAVRGADDR